MTSDVALRIALVVAAIAGLVVLLGIFGTGVRIACLVLIALLGGLSVIIGAIIGFPREAEQ